MKSWQLRILVCVLLAAILTDAKHEEDENDDAFVDTLQLPVDFGEPPPLGAVDGGQRLHHHRPDAKVKAPPLQKTNGVKASPLQKSNGVKASLLQKNNGVQSGPPKQLKTPEMSGKPSKTRFSGSGHSKKNLSKKRRYTHAEASTLNAKARHKKRGATKLSRYNLKNLREEVEDVFKLPIDGSGGANSNPIDKDLKYLGSTLDKVDRILEERKPPSSGSNLLELHSQPVNSLETLPSQQNPELNPNGGLVGQPENSDKPLHFKRSRSDNSQTGKLLQTLMDLQSVGYKLTNSDPNDQAARGLFNNISDTSKLLAKYLNTDFVKKEELKGCTGCDKSGPPTTPRNSNFDGLEIQNGPRGEHFQLKHISREFPPFKKHVTRFHSESLHNKGLTDDNASTNEKFDGLLANGHNELEKELAYIAKLTKPEADGFPELIACVDGLNLTDDDATTTSSCNTTETTTCEPSSTTQDGPKTNDLYVCKEDNPYICSPKVNATTECPSKATSKSSSKSSKVKKSKTTCKTTCPTTTKSCTTTGPTTTQNSTTSLATTPECTTCPTTTKKCTTPCKTTTKKCSTPSKTTTKKCTTPCKTTTKKCTTPCPTTTKKCTTCPTTTKKCTTTCPTTTKKSTTPCPTTTQNVTTPCPTTLKNITTCPTTTKNGTTTCPTTTKKCTTCPTTTKKCTTCPTTTKKCTTCPTTTKKCTTTCPTTTKKTTTACPTTTKKCTTTCPTTTKKCSTTCPTTTKKCTTTCPTTTKKITTCPTTTKNITTSPTTTTTKKCTTACPTTIKNITTCPTTTKKCTTTCPTTTKKVTTCQTTTKKSTTACPTTKATTCSKTTICPRSTTKKTRPTTCSTTCKASTTKSAPKTTKPPATTKETCSIQSTPRKNISTGICGESSTEKGMYDMFDIFTPGSGGGDSSSTESPFRSFDSSTSKSADDETTSFNLFAPGAVSEFTSEATRFEILISTTASYTLTSPCTMEETRYEIMTTPLASPSDDTFYKSDSGLGEVKTAMDSEGESPKACSIETADNNAPAADIYDLFSPGKTYDVTSSSLTTECDGMDDLKVDKGESKSMLNNVDEVVSPLKITNSRRQTMESSVRSGGVPKNLRSPVYDFNERLNEIGREMAKEKSSEKTTVEEDRKEETKICPTETDDEVIQRFDVGVDDLMKKTGDAAKNTTPKETFDLKELNDFRKAENGKTRKRRFVKDFRKRHNDEGEDLNVPACDDDKKPPCRTQSCRVDKTGRKNTRHKSRKIQKSKCDKCNDFVIGTKSCCETTSKPTCSSTCSTSKPTCSTTSKPTCSTTGKPTCSTTCKPTCKSTCKPTCKPTCKSTCKPTCKSTCSTPGDKAALSEDEVGEVQNLLKFLGCTGDKLKDDSDQGNKLSECGVCNERDQQVDKERQDMMKRLEYTIVSTCPTPCPTTTTACSTCRRPSPTTCRTTCKPTCPTTCESTCENTCQKAGKTACARTCKPQCSTTCTTPIPNVNDPDYDSASGADCNNDPDGDLMDVVDCLSSCPGQPKIDPDRPGVITVEVTRETSVKSKVVQSHPLNNKEDPCTSSRQRKNSCGIRRAAGSGVELEHRRHPVHHRGARKVRGKTERGKRRIRRDMKEAEGKPDKVVVGDEKDDRIQEKRRALCETKVNKMVSKCNTCEKKPKAELTDKEIEEIRSLLKTLQDSDPPCDDDVQAVTNETKSTGNDTSNSNTNASTTSAMEKTQTIICKPGNNATLVDSAGNMAIKFIIGSKKPFPGNDSSKKTDKTEIIIMSIVPPNTKNDCSIALKPADQPNPKNPRETIGNRHVETWLADFGKEKLREGMMVGDAGKEKLQEGMIGKEKHQEGMLVENAGKEKHQEGMLVENAGKEKHQQGMLVENAGKEKHQEGMLVRDVGKEKHQEGMLVGDVGKETHQEGMLVGEVGKEKHQERMVVGDFGKEKHQEGMLVGDFGKDKHQDRGLEGDVGKEKHKEGMLVEDVNRERNSPGFTDFKRDPRRRADAKEEVVERTVIEAEPPGSKVDGDVERRVKRLNYRNSRRFR